MGRRHSAWKPISRRRVLRATVAATAASSAQGEVPIARRPTLVAVAATVQGAWSMRGGGFSVGPVRGIGVDVESGCVCERRDYRERMFTSSFYRHKEG